MESKNELPEFSLSFMAHQLGDPLDDNVDVYLTFPNGDNYVATFYTLRNIQALMAKDRKSGENCNGLYFWGTGMVIIDHLSEESFRAAAEDLIREGMLEQAFEGPFRLEDESE